MFNWWRHQKKAEATATTTTTTGTTGTTGTSGSSSGGATAGQTILTALNSGAGFNVDAVVSAIVTSEGAGQTAQFNQQGITIDEASADTGFAAAFNTARSALAFR